jgi:serine/threonine-protein kinase RsbW
MKHGRHHLTLQSRFDELERAVNETESFFAAVIDDDELVYKLVLLMSEAVTNAIEHGSAGAETQRVDVWLETTEAEARVIVEDEGGGFQRESVRDPLAPDNLMDDGGRGIFLMESMADDVTWSHGGRRVTLKVHLPDGS